MEEDQPPLEFSSKSHNQNLTKQLKGKQILTQPNNYRQLATEWATAGVGDVPNTEVPKWLEKPIRDLT